MSTLPFESLPSMIPRFHCQPQPRTGQDSDRSEHTCPFFKDRDPNLCVYQGEEKFRCFGCWARRDSADFARRHLPSLSFNEVVRAIGGPTPHSLNGLEGPASPPPPHLAADHLQWWEGTARKLVEEAESLLWSEQGTWARSYLAQRGLTESTIRKARLGYCHQDQTFSDTLPGETVLVPKGIIIPWLEPGCPEMISVHRPGRDSRYVVIGGNRRGGIYPARPEIATGKPLVIVERELDALLLGQELDEVASVVAIDKAGAYLSPRILHTMVKANPWIITGEADEAGKRSADRWMALSDRCVRVTRPEGMGRSWSEAHHSGLNLREHWITTIRRLNNGVVPSPEPTQTVEIPSPEITEDYVEEVFDLGTIYPTSDRWRCLSRYCMDKGKWWMSEHGIVQCMNCRPPSFPWLIIVEGNESNAPIVEPDRSSQAVAWPGSTIRKHHRAVGPKP